MSADGRVLAWKVALKGGGCKIVTNGIESRSYADAGRPTLSRDGGVVAHRAADSDDRWFIVVNGQRVTASFELVTDPAVSRDGKVIAYACEGEVHTLVVGTKKIEIPELPRSVFLSPSGDTWGYLSARTSKSGSSVVTAVGRSEAFDEISSAEFDPEGRRVAFGARSGDQCFIVIENRKYEAPGLVDGPFWSADGKQVGYGALLGHEIWWKVMSTR